jgi:hypothetical protein
LVFLEAFVVPGGLPRRCFAGRILALRILGILLFCTSIYSSCQASSRLSIAGTVSGSGMLSAVNIGSLWSCWLAELAELGLGIGILQTVAGFCVSV